MRQLDRCDFCDGPADGVYEVLPPAVEADERRLVLCADCRDTLATVVEPLLAELGAPAPSPAPGDSSAASDVTVAPDDADAGVTAAADAANEDADEASNADVANEDATAGGEAEAVADADDAVSRAAAEVAADVVGSPGGERPQGYATVLRLLRNRPDGMTRADLAELAGSAYDLPERAVEAAVEAGVENGDLEADGDRVRTP